MNWNGTATGLTLELVAIPVGGGNEVATIGLCHTIRLDKRFGVGVVLAPKGSIYEDELLVGVYIVLAAISDGFVVLAIPEKVTLRNAVCESIVGAINLVSATINKVERVFHKA